MTKPIFRCLSITLITLMAFSCKKSDTQNTTPSGNYTPTQPNTPTPTAPANPASFKVTYSIKTVDSLITAIKYADANGDTVALTPSAFTGSVQSVTVTKRPYPAFLRVEYENLRGPYTTYDLSISVDGKVAANQSFSVSGNTMGSYTFKTTIN